MYETFVQLKQGVPFLDTYLQNIFPHMTFVIVQGDPRENMTHLK